MVEEDALVEVDLVRRRLRLEQCFSLAQHVHGVARLRAAGHEKLLLEVGFGEEVFAVRIAAVRPGVVVDERPPGIDNRIMQFLLPVMR